MTEDREVLREVWQGRIPASFAVTPEEVTSSLNPENFYLMLPRLSYFALCAEKIRKYFSKFVSEEAINSTIWFEYRGSPLRMHLPIGVIYDQLKTEDNKGVELGPPWSITVRFGNFPGQDLLRCHTREDIETHFMSCIKEADQFKHGGRIMSTLQKKDHHQLWQGLANDKFDQFWAVNRRLMDVTTSSTQGRSGSPTSGAEASNSTDEGNFKTFKNIPVRMYRDDHLLSLRLIKPMKPCEGIDRMTTLQDLIEDYFPSEADSLTITTQGINPDRDAPLQWMSEHLSYPDNFLHIISHKN